MPKTQIIKRFEWCDRWVPMFEDSLGPNDLIVFDHATGIAYTGDMRGGSGHMAREIADRYNTGEFVEVEGIPLYLEGLV